MALDGKVLAADKPPMIPGVDFKKVVDGVTGGSLTIKLGTEVSLRGVAVCKDVRSAGEVKTQAEALQKAAVDALKTAPPGALPKGALDLPGKVKIATKGILCEATVSVKSDDVIGFVKGMMFPQPPEKKP
jgi:hypothetical protein